LALLALAGVQEATSVGPVLSVAHATVAYGWVEFGAAGHDSTPTVLCVVEQTVVVQLLAADSVSGVQLATGTSGTSFELHVVCV
jgi:hypothetical protein